MNIDEARKKYSYRQLAEHLYQAGLYQKLFHLLQRRDWYLMKHSNDWARASYVDDIQIAWKASIEEGISGLPWVFALSLLFANEQASAKQVSPTVLSILIKLGEDVRAQAYASALRDVDDVIPAYYQMGLTYKELGKLTQAKQMLEKAHYIARRYENWPDIGRTTAQLCRLGDIAIAEDVIMSIDTTVGLDTRVEILCEIALALAEIEQKKRAEQILLDIVNLLTKKEAKRYKTTTLSRFIFALSYIGCRKGFRQLIEWLKHSMSPSSWLKQLPDVVYGLAVLEETDELIRTIKQIMPFVWRHQSLFWLLKYIDSISKQISLNIDPQTFITSERKSALIKCLKSASKATAVRNELSSPTLLFELVDFIQQLEVMLGNDLNIARGWLACGFFRSGNQTEARELIGTKGHRLISVFLSNRNIRLHDGSFSEAQKSLVMTIPLFLELKLQNSLIERSVNFETNFQHLSINHNIESAALLTEALVRIGRIAEARKLLVKVLNSIQRIIKEASPAPTNERRLKGWKVFVDPEFIRAAESIYAFQESLMLLGDINLFKKCYSIFGIAKEKASNPIPILEIEADFCLAIEDRNGAVQAIDQLLDIADTLYSNEETEAARISALSSIGYWLIQSANRYEVERLMAQVENKVLHLDQFLLNSVHIEAAAIGLSRIYGTDEAVKILSPVLEIDVSAADHTFHLSSLALIARAMAHLHFTKGLDQILDVFERINWDDKLNLEGQGFIQFLPALGDGCYAKGLSRSVSISRDIKDGFLCTRPIVLASIAREYSKLNRPAHALLLLSQAIAGIKDVDDQDYRVTAKAMISRIAAEIAHQEQNSIQLHQYAIDAAQELSAAAFKDLDTHPFIKRNSAYITVSALIGTLVWFGEVDIALSWLRETPDGIWGAAAIPNIARALRYHNDAEVLLELLKISQRLVGSVGFADWMVAARVIGHLLDQVSETDPEKILSPTVDAFDTARYGGPERVWVYIATFSGILWRSGLLAQAWRCIAAVEAIKIDESEHSAQEDGNTPPPFSVQNDLVQNNQLREWLTYETLLEIAVIDPDRKALWKDAQPYLDQQELNSMYSGLWKLLAGQYALKTQRMWQSIIQEMLTGVAHYSVEDLDDLAEEAAFQILTKLPNGEASTLTSDQIYQFIHALEQLGIPEEARMLLRNT